MSGDNSRQDYRQMWKGLTRSDLIRIAQIDEIRTLVDQSGSSSAAIIAALSSLSLEVTTDQINLNTDTLEASNDAIQANTNRSNLKRLKDEANDLIKTFSYLDAGLDDERISTIVYSSVVLSLTVTETLVYAGISPKFRVSTITLS